MAVIWLDIPFCIRRPLLLSAKSKIHLSYSDRTNICWFIYEIIFKQLLNYDRTLYNDISAENLTTCITHFLESVANSELTKFNTDLVSNSDVSLYNQKKTDHFSYQLTEKLKVYKASLRKKDNERDVGQDSTPNSGPKALIVFSNCTTLMKMTIDSSNPVNPHFVGNMSCPFSTKNRPGNQIDIADESKLLSSIPTCFVRDIEDMFSIDVKKSNYLIDDKKLYSSNLSMECKANCHSCTSSQKIGYNIKSSKLYKDFRNPVEKFIGDVSL
jgi:hypothetical protein